MSAFHIGDEITHRWLPAGMSGAGFFVGLNEKGRAIITNYDPRNGEYPRCREGSYQTTWAVKNTRRIA